MSSLAVTRYQVFTTAVKLIFGMSYSRAKHSSIVGGIFRTLESACGGHFWAHWYFGDIFGQSLLSQKDKHEFINWWKGSSFQTTSFCQHQTASPFTTWIDWAYQACMYPRWLVVGRMHCKRANTRCYRMGLAVWKWEWMCPTIANSWWNFYNWQRHTNMQLQKDNMQIVQMHQMRTCLSAILRMWEILWKFICNPSL